MRETMPQTPRHPPVRLVCASLAMLGIWPCTALRLIKPEHAPTPPAHPLPPAPPIRAHIRRRARAELLACRGGPEPPWQLSSGPLAGFAACTGRVTFAFPGLIFDSGVRSGPLSVVADDAPLQRLECGPGCAIA